jgi:hypothetical protein
MGIFFPEESLIGVGGSRNFSIAATAGQRDDLACFGTGRRGKNVFKKSGKIFRSTFAPQDS